MRGKNQRGQAMTEYAIIALLFAIVLFAPWVPSPWPLDASAAPGSPTGQGTISIFMLFVEVFDIYINSFHLVISLPVP